ncbi:hypothetical protein GOBAR_AA03757 [Gossypium barbadense]|uniref:Uncharacterized protein n=1 Tax=Gossypium barbadense TaxID=3634 RepID=A0A2P5YMM0_GOSBA|nr:hypothetical protein GOBAR_AA03757 [Gossypium barbadense]
MENDHSILKFKRDRIPGCAKSALCKELLNTPGGLGDDRPVQSLMGDLIKALTFAWLLFLYTGLAMRENILRANGNDIRPCNITWLLIMFNLQNQLIVESISELQKKGNEIE